VIVAATGLVEGSINSQEAYIAGRVEGDIRASEKLTLASSDVVKSDLYTPSLSIEEGATFNGVSHMQLEEEASDDASNTWQAAEEDILDNELFEEENGEVNGELKMED
jgi:cytoskeletal protein CcmA (bactofilin family)